MSKFQGEALLASLPPEPDPKLLPAHLDRKSVAIIVTHYFFPVSSRTVEAWPLPYRVVGGRAVYRTADVLAHARQILQAAPLIKGGRRRSSAREAAHA